MVRLLAVVSEFSAIWQYGDLDFSIEKNQDLCGFGFALTNNQLAKERISYRTSEREDVLQDLFHSYSFESLLSSVTPSYIKSINLEDECIHTGLQRIV